MHPLENNLQVLDPYCPYMHYFEGQVEDTERTLPFFNRYVLDCVRYLLRQIAYEDDLVYTFRFIFDSEGERIYAEMDTTDWWWDVQAQRPSLLYGNVC